MSEYSQMSLLHVDINILTKLSFHRQGVLLSLSTGPIGTFGGECFCDGVTCDLHSINIYLESLTRPVCVKEDIED